MSILPKEFKDFIGFLFEKCPDNRTPQVIFAKEKRAMLWLPGNKEVSGLNHIKRIADKSNSYGVTPGAYKDFLGNQHNQDCLICMAGIDIDGYKFQEDFDETINILMEHFPYLTLRTSNSGRGIHAFLRLENPILVPQGVNRTQVIYNITKPIVEEMIEEGIPVEIIDKWDYRTFYIVGGKQNTIYISQEFYNAPKTILNLDKETVSLNSNPKDRLLDEMQPEVKNIVNFLTDNGFSLKMGVKNNIRVGDIYPLVKGTEFEFKTKSKMRWGETGTNGFIEFTPDKFVLYSCPDNQAVLVIVSSQSLYNLLGIENNKEMGKVL